MSGGVKWMLYGLVCLVGGILWTSVWRAWGDLWEVVKGGIGLSLLATALITLALGLVQVHEDRRDSGLQEEGKTG